MSEPTTAPADAIVGEVALPHITENGVGVWADEDDSVHYGDPTSPGFLAAKQRADEAFAAQTADDAVVKQADLGGTETAGAGATETGDASASTTGASSENTDETADASSSRRRGR